MNYLPYVIGAYAVFIAVLAWDFVSTRLQVRRALRAARQRALRPARARAQPADTELLR